MPHDILWFKSNSIITSKLFKTSGTNHSTNIPPFKGILHNTYKIEKVIYYTQINIIY